MAVGNSRPQNRILEVGIWAKRGFIVNQGSTPGKYGIFSEYNAQINENGGYRSMRKNFSVQLETLSRALSLAYEYNNRVRVLTVSRIVCDIINDFNGERELATLYRGAIRNAIEKVWRQMQEFKIVEVERCRRGHPLIEEAVSLVLGYTFKPKAADKNAYRKNGLPVVYTHASVKNHGNKGAVRIGQASLDWGPNDRRNATFAVPGEQTSNRAQFTGPIEALKECLASREKGVYIRTNSELFVKTINLWIEDWKANDWKRVKRAKLALKNVDLLKKFDELHQKMKAFNRGRECVFVEYHRKDSRNRGQPLHDDFDLVTKFQNMAV